MHTSFSFNEATAKINHTNENIKVVIGLSRWNQGSISQKLIYPMANYPHEALIKSFRF